MAVPNPQAKLLDQVRDLMRLRHYSIRTEQSYCDWIKRSRSGIEANIYEPHPWTERQTNSEFMPE